MRTIGVINATTLNEYSFMPFAGGPSAFERVMGLFLQLCEARDILVLGGQDFDPAWLAEGASLIQAPRWRMQALLDKASAFALARADADILVYAHGDSPFLDLELCEGLLALHRQYRAEYTYADGYPPGFAPEILSVRALPNITELAGRHDMAADRDGLFAVIQKDINSYDIETELAPKDLRGYRLSPLCDTKRNMRSAEALYAAGLRRAKDVLEILPSHPELLRTLPAFLWVQISEGCPQSCSYCPYPLMGGDPRAKTGFMPAKSFDSLMSQAEALSDDIVVDLSLWGEPSLHPDFGAIAASVLARKRFTLLVETCGIGWKPGVAEAVAEAGGERVHWIVSLDDPDPASYLALRGEGMAEASDFTRRMAERFPGQVHAQAVRMQGNEERLESFYRSWKKDIEKVIIQKYDAFSGTLPRLSVADLSPLERFPCRHLARDLAVLIDGSVPPCKHCLVAGGTRQGAAQGSGLGYAEILGNAFDSGGLAEAWSKASSWYDEHVQTLYPACCEACDEYHTFNA
jgi:spiro-SPASM protein